MFREDPDRTVDKVVLDELQHNVITPETSNTLRNMTSIFDWHLGDVIKKGSYQEHREKGKNLYLPLLRLNTDFSFCYQGEIDLAMPREAISAALQRVMTYHQKTCYSKGAYFVPKMNKDDQVGYDLLFLNFHLFVSNTPSKFYVVGGDGTPFKSGAFGQIYFLSGVVKPAHGIVGAMEFFPFPSTKKVVVKAQENDFKEFAYKFVCYVQQEAHCQRELGDVKVKSSSLFAIDARDQSFKLSDDRKEYYKSVGDRKTHALITMPFVFGWVLGELYDLGTDAANSQQHLEEIECQELEVRNKERANNKIFSEEQNEKDKVLAAKISARTFLRTPEGRFIVTRQLILTWKRLRETLQIVHGDLKLSNIMLEYNLETGAVSVKFLDFGSSFQLSDDIFALEERDISGSPKYMAPELVPCLIGQPHGLNDFATDEYSLALVLMHVWGDLALSLRGMSQEQLAKMRMSDASVKHDLFHGIELPENVKTNISNIFTELTRLEPLKRLTMNAALVAFELARIDYFKSRYHHQPQMFPLLEASHRLALDNSCHQLFWASASTHLKYAEALCAHLKNMIASLPDEPDAIRLFAQTIGIAAFMHLLHKNEMEGAIAGYLEAYQVSYEQCQSEADKFKPLAQMKEVIAEPKHKEYEAYCKHATLFMQKRTSKRCKFDELRIEAKHMERKSEKFKKAGAYFGMK